MDFPYRERNLQREGLKIILEGPPSLQLSQISLFLIYLSAVWKH